MTATTAGPDPLRDDLRRALHDAVDGIEPRPGLDAIRARTADQASGSRRAWLCAVGAAGGHRRRRSPPSPWPATTHGPTADDHPAGQVTPSGDATDAPSDGPDRRRRRPPTAVRRLDAVPRSPRRSTSPATRRRARALFREFQRVDAGDRLRAARHLVLRGAAGRPRLPDPVARRVPRSRASPSTGSAPTA